MNDKTVYWESIYKSKRPDTVSWYQSSPGLSLEFIGRTGLGKDGAIVDAGGGASTLVDNLLYLGYSDLTVVDISSEALDYLKARLGTQASDIRWIVGDITSLDPSQLTFDLWHDRAVFHFLVEEEDRRRYIRLLDAVLRPGGFVIIAAFGPNGPLKCSGLNIVRYSADSLSRALGDTFELISSQVENHRTPSGATQEFVYCLFQKVHVTLSYDHA